MALDTRVQVGPNGWPGIFIPGDSAMCNVPVLRYMADGLEAGTFPVGLTAGYLRALADKLEACYVIDTTEREAIIQKQRECHANAS